MQNHVEDHLMRLGLTLLTALCLLAPGALARDPGSSPPGADYLRAEVQGTLTIADKVQTDLGAIKASYGRLDTGAFITVGDTWVDVYLGKDLLETARKLRGQKVTLAGDILLLAPPEGTERLSTIRPLQPRFLIQTTAIKAAKEK
jgi:hypothetical protein